MIALKLPDKKYKNTYLDAVKELQEHDSDNESTDHYFKNDLAQWDKQFDNFVDSLIDAQKGIGIKEGYVPGTVFWIIDDQGKYCGRISLRHRLNEKLSKIGGHIGYDIIPSERGKHYASIALGHCLKEAKKMGIHSVLITCDDDNIPSFKTIERNGGILRDIIDHDGVLIRRYDIEN